MLLSKSFSDRCSLAVGPSKPGLQLVRAPHVCAAAETTNFSASAQVVFASAPTGQVGVAAPALQTYIQESASYTSSELSARLSSMHAARRRAAGTVRRASPLMGTSSLARASAAAAAVSPAPTSATAAPPSPTSTLSVNTPAAGYSSSSSSSGAGAAATITFTASTSNSVPTSSLVVPEPEAEQEQEEQQQQEWQGQEATASDAAPAAPSSAAAGSQSVPGSLAGLSASEKLKQLQAVQHMSRQALQQAPTSSYYTSAPKTVDVRMYEQLVAAHNRQSQKLMEVEAFAAVQAEVIQQCNDDLMAAFELFKQIGMEYGTTSRMANSAVAAVQFGVDPKDAVEKIVKLQQRLTTLEEAVQDLRQEFGKKVVRKVPVEWVGVASEVRIMGDFDGWTRGEDLSAEDVTSDTVYQRFEGSLQLRPGEYRVKLLVDGEWRLASGWPTGDDGKGNEVNVLTVE